MHTMRQKKEYKVWFLSLLVVSLPSVVFGGSFFSGQPKSKKQQDPREQQIERDIQRRVAREVKKEKFRKSQRTIKDLIYPTKEQEEKLGKLATFVHKVPSWPFMSLFFEQRDFFQIDLHGSTASQSYA